MDTNIIWICMFAGSIPGFAAGFYCGWFQFYHLPNQKKP